MEKYSALSKTFLFLATLFFLLFNGCLAGKHMKNDELEEWGYVEVRPSKFNFVKNYRAINPTKNLN